MKLRSAAVVLAALLPSAVAAQTMDFACPDPGTTFTYDSGTKVVAKGRDGMDCTMEIAGGKPYKLRALLFDNPSPDGRDMSAFIDALKPERLWPLDVGKKIEARYSAGGQTWNYILTVVRYEKRSGPGEAMIDTFLIEMQEQGAGGREHFCEVFTRGHADAALAASIFHSGTVLVSELKHYLREQAIPVRV